jgi:hypothetical protein
MGLVIQGFLKSQFNVGESVICCMTVDALPKKFTIAQVAASRTLSPLSVESKANGIKKRCLTATIHPSYQYDRR